MEVILGKRRSGKTTELIKRSAESGMYILVPDKIRANVLFDHALRIGYIIPFPITVNECRNNRYTRGSSIIRNGLLIDEAEAVLKQFLRPIEIHAVTVTERNVTKLESHNVSNTCEFCQGAKPLVIGKTDDYGICICYPDTLMAYGYDVHGFGSNGLTTSIQYCPMCGRKLNQEDR